MQINRVKESEPEMEKTTITKPVASRPNCSSLRSFSSLLAAPIDPAHSDGTAIAAIRPKIIRFKPQANQSPTMAAVVTVQVQPVGSSEENVRKLNSGNSTIVYKPRATVVSSSTVSFLSTMHSRSHCSGGDLHQTKVALQNVEDDSKPLLSPATSDRPSYDGYTWRKYGQKQVKGSEYPRSYYKCTHPNCAAKKKMERSGDGQIAEVVYKGEHHHPKPQPPRGSSLGTRQDHEVNIKGRGIRGGEPVGVGSVSIENYSCGRGSECNEDGSNWVGEMEEDEPRLKRRKCKSNPPAEAGFSGEGAQEAPTVLQNSTEPEMVGDGFRWRKYGQKVVKGNPYPRSYYRCTSSVECNVRKHVERVSDDPDSFVTTYEGRHNHEKELALLKTTTNAAEGS